MSYRSCVLYPRTEGTTFDMKYYTDTHMPLVEKSWGPTGLVKWEVVEFLDEFNGVESPYNVAAYLIWKDEASMKASLAGGATAAVFQDVGNFTQQKPIFIAGRLVSENHVGGSA